MSHPEPGRPSLMENKRHLFLIFTALFLITMTFQYHLYRVGGSDTFHGGFSIPLLSPVGMDFRAIYRSSSALINGDRSLSHHTAYPPMVSVFFIPFALMEEDLAYRVFTGLLLLATFGMIYLSLSMNPILFDGKERAFLAAVILASVYHTYPMLFALERGNNDLLTAFFSVASLYFLTRGKCLPATLLLFAAIQLKLYPAVLVAVLMVRSRLRYTILLVLMSLLSLFVLGPGGFRYFVKDISSLAVQPFTWVGNHSLKSWLARTNLESPVSGDHYVFSGMLAFLLLVFLLLWLFRYVPALKSHRDGDSRPGETSQAPLPAELAVVGMAFQLMSLVPNISHDYKLGIQIVPFLMVLSSPDTAWNSRSRTVRLALVFLLAVCLSSILGPPGFRQKTVYLVASFFVYGSFALLDSSDRDPKSSPDRTLRQGIGTGKGNDTAKG